MYLSFQDLSNNVSPPPPPKKDPSPPSKTEKMSSRICSNCHKENPAAKVCGRCKLIYYCNGECQKTHWVFHKTICREPQKVNLRYTTWDFDGKQTSAKVSMKIHSEEASQQPFTKQIGIPGIKSSAFKEMTGQNISVNAEKDLVCFTAKYSKDFVIQLRKHGYNGLSTVESEKLEELLHAQNYSKILKFIWSEKDIEYKLKWLQEQASKGHVILMFEIGRATLELQKPSKDQILEAYKWRTLGRIHTHLDAACFGDTSLVAASSDLTSLYNLDSLFQKFILVRDKKTFSANIQAQNNIIKDIQLKEGDPSPKWLLFHGMEFMMGVSTLAAPEKWLELRSNRLQIMIQEFLRMSEKSEKN